MRESQEVINRVLRAVMEQVPHIGLYCGPSEELPSPADCALIVIVYLGENATGHVEMGFSMMQVRSVSDDEFDEFVDGFVASTVDRVNKRLAGNFDSGVGVIDTEPNSNVSH